MPKLTLEKIAKLAGVSRSTVSRVVNNHASVKPAVRQRVLEVIEATGYRPDPAARSLAGRRSGIIGLVIPRTVQFLFTDPYYPRLMQGITQACNSFDYTLSLFLCHTQAEEQKLLSRILNNQLVDGVIISASPIDDPLIPQLIKNDVPFVMIGRPTDTGRASFVDADNIGGAYSAVSYLIRRGRQRIATIMGPQNTAVGLRRRQGYLNAFSDRGLAVIEKLMVEGDFTEAGGYMAMQWLLPHHPDAVFVASDTMAMGALRALRGAGLAVPGDVAVIGFDDLPSSAVSDPPLTTVRQPIRRIGAQAVETLVDILANGSQPPRQLEMDTQLILRCSCGANQEMN